MDYNLLEVYINNWFPSLYVEKTPYIIIGSPEVQCPADCLWPMDGLLKPPSGCAGASALATNFAAALAAAVTNPFHDGWYVGPKFESLEAATVCARMYGSKAGPNNPGTVLTDVATGGGYNACGLGGKKYLLPALWNPITNSCWTLL